MKIGHNNSLFLKDQPYDGMKYVYAPSLLGGSIAYDVDLRNVDCRCVAGVYLVATNDYGCGEDATVENP